MTSPVSDIFPLTPAQAGLLLGSLTEPAPGIYVVQMRYALTGRLDPERLQRAWESLVRRHAVLRTAISWERTAHPVNVVMTAADVPVAWVDLREDEGVAPAGAVEDFLLADRLCGFDLTRAPLSRVTVVRTAEAAWQMVWTHHHIILDGWSTARLTGELWQLYTGGTPAPTSLDFAGYAARLADDAFRHRDADTAHWRERISHGDTLAWFDRSRAGEPGIWTDHERPIDRARLAEWSEGARTHGVTVATLHHAAWALTLRGAGLGPDRLVLGTVADTRGAEGTDVVGLCVASVPLRVSFEDVPICSWLRAIAVERAAGQDHARANLAEHRTWSSDGAEQPFRYLLAVETYPHEALIDPQTGADLTVRYLGVHESTEYALTAGVPAGSPCLKLTIDTRRISSDDALTLLDQWAACLDLLADRSPHRSLYDVLDSLPDANSEPRLDQRIANVARQHPDRTAFRDATCHLTFAQLDRLARRLALRLHRDGVATGDRIGVLVDDSVWVAVSVLGTLSAGAVVVPLDPRHPAPYREAVLSTARVSRVLTSGRDVRPDWGATPVLVASELATDDPGPDTAEPVGAAPAGRRMAFLVHDAGSALRPSAHAHDHRSVLEMALAAGTVLGTEAGHSWAVTSPATGPGAPWEMWAAPLRGGCTVLAPGLQHEPDELLRLGSGTTTVIGVAGAEAPGLAAQVGERFRVVTLSRDDGELTLRTATNEALGVVGRTAVETFPDPGIAEVLLSLPDVAACEVSRDPDGSLVAVVATWSGSPQTHRLTRALRSALPEDRVPRIVTPAVAVSQQPGEHRRAEEQVSELWAKVLDLSEVPLDTPFFDLGGHSLKLFVVLRGLRGQGWTSLTMTDLLAHPTVRSLSRRMARQQPSGSPSRTAEAGPRPSASAARRERGRA